MIAPSCMRRVLRAGALLSLASWVGCESPPVADSDLKPVDEPAVAILAQVDASEWLPANSGIEGADVRALAIDPLAPRTLYASTLDGGLYKSVDGARSWRLSGAGLPRTPGAIAVHPRRSGTVYVATANGVYKSIDGGRNFSEPSDPHGPLFAPLLIAPSDPNVLYVRGPGGYVLRSEDAGSSWTFSTQELAWYVVHPRDASTLYGITNRGEVYKTQNGGLRFTRIGVELPMGAAPGASTLALDPGQPDTLYVGIAGHGLYRSRDGGLTFELVGADVAGGLAYHAIVVAPRSSRHILLSASLPSREGGLFVSENEGASFLQSGFVERPLDMLIDPRDERNVYLASSEGAHKSSDRGVTFVRTIAGFHDVDVHHLVADPRIPGVLQAAGRHALCRSSDWGGRWSCSHTLPETEITALVGDPTHARSAYVGFRMPPRRVRAAAEPEGVDVRDQPATLFRTDDGGRTWQPTTGDIGAFAILTPLAVTPDSGDVLVMGRGHIDAHGTDAEVGLLRSNDRGASWQVLGVPAGFSGVLLAVSATHLFAASELGGMFESRDGGVSWARVDIDVMAVTGLAVDPRDHQVLYASARLSSPPYPLSGGLRKSVDGGRTWSAPYEPLAQADVSGVTVSPVDGRVYVRTFAEGSDRAVLTSNDGGRSFVAAGGGLSPNTMLTLIADPFRACTAYAGTVGQGVFITQRAGGVCPL